MSDSAPSFVHLRFRAPGAAFGAVLSACFVLSRTAGAEQLANDPQSRVFNWPHTMAELGIGVLTLPGADVCLTGSNAQSPRCKKGDSSIEANFWQMYRFDRRWALGAGATMAIVPTQDDFGSQSGGLPRSHTRSYFLVEGQGRFYAVQWNWVQAWLSATAGLVVVSDRYVIEGDPATEAAIVGPRSSTLRTEGAAVGMQLGGNWTLSPAWAVGAGVGYARWYLPSNAHVNVLGDRATLTSVQNVVQAGLSVTYRIFQQWGARGVSH